VKQHLAPIKNSGPFYYAEWVATWLHNQPYKSHLFLMKSLRNNAEKEESHKRAVERARQQTPIRAALRPMPHRTEAKWIGWAPNIAAR
jgi:hypothetical protein